MFSVKEQIVPTLSLVGSMVGVAAAPLCLHTVRRLFPLEVDQRG